MGWCYETMIRLRCDEIKDGKKCNELLYIDVTGLDANREYEKLDGLGWVKYSTGTATCPGCRK